MNNRTKVAVLGTLAEFHYEPIPYDLSALVDLVVDVHPDLLCLDMTLEEWRQQSLNNLPPEYREALLPLAYQTDIVMVPIRDEHAPNPLKSAGWRGWVIDRLQASLAVIQRQAPGPDAINHGWRHELSNLLYHSMTLLSGDQIGGRQKQHADQLSQRVREVAQENPGSRILAVVNVQYCHLIRSRLRQEPDILEVKYTEL